MVFAKVLDHIVLNIMEFCELTHGTICLQVLQGLEAATLCVDDIDEWLRIFNVKLRHMREDIASVISYSDVNFSYYIMDIIRNLFLFSTLCIKYCL